MGDLLPRAALATLVAVIGGGIGVLAGTLLGRIAALVGAAAGALLAVTLVSILPEAAEHGMSPISLALAVLSGYLLLFLIGKFVFPICPACAGEAIEARIAARRMEGIVALLAFVVALHSLIDGVAVAVDQALHEGGGMPLFLAVSLHKLPEGLALAALLLRAGRTPRAALLGTAAIEMTTLLGALIGFAALRGLPSFWLGALLAHAGGGFIYLAVHTLLGAAPIREKAAQIRYGTLGFASVALLLWGLQRLPR